MQLGELFQTLLYIVLLSFGGLLRLGGVVLNIDFRADVLLAKGPVGVERCDGYCQRRPEYAEEPEAGVLQ